MREYSCVCVQAARTQKLPRLSTVLLDELSAIREGRVRLLPPPGANAGRVPPLPEHLSSSSTSLCLVWCVCWSEPDTTLYMFKHPGAAMACPSSVGVAAEHDAELFDVLDSEGNELGRTELRAVCHATGVWHKVHLYSARVRACVHACERACTHASALARPMPPARRTAAPLCTQAVYALLFNGQGQLLVQRRSQEKRVCPGLWDLSVGA